MTLSPDISAAEALAAAVEAGRDEAVALLAELVALQKQGEAAVLDRVADALAALGGLIESISYEPADVPLIDEFATGPAMDAGKRRAVVARFAGDGTGRSLLVFAHPDSERFTDATNWQHDPFAASVAEGRMHGWGIADDLAGVAAVVAALAALRKAGLSLAGALAVAITPSKRHARGIAAVLERGPSAEGALYLHPAESGAGLAEIKAFASGVLEFEIEVAGVPPATQEPSHTAFAHQAVHPLDKAMLLIDALRRLDARRGARIHHPRLEAAVGRSTNILIASISAGDDGMRQRVPAGLRLSGSISFPPTESMKAVQAEVEVALAAAAADDAFLSQHPPTLRWLSGVSGSDVADDHPLYEIAARAIADITGIAARVNPMHTSSDIRNPLVQKGIPAIGLGPLCGNLTHAGGHDEWVDIEDHLRTVTVAATIMTRWCGTASQGEAPENAA
ncbi:M20/M25/M40 family metallo-hydrolase [Mesorhizobium sp. BR1-1-16]|uniref:M20/M25/M40 family metallo-hydrolase n=1 Tax=Mesorhizobium sp. BR1-1-16 TaxID=2876653 RepID=UPI001CCBC04A|nr:M20/M25/M40 family metallo-hydrolase [Mesorhizobium sp. BR1-1-16]MBZ9938854.1 M20/M25/M40 family metallo-hydrolase [Mesorhizobium sp. BR1-1-16]